MGRKVGSVVPILREAMGALLTQCQLGRGMPP